jgi:hypothetical protein
MRAASTLFQNQRLRKLMNFALDHFQLSIVILVFLGVLVTAFLVHYEFSFLNFFFLPVILAGYYLGKREAVLFSTFCVLVVILYLVFARLLASPGAESGLSLDQIRELATWGGFLILTGAIIGGLSEKREKELKKMRQAYVGVLGIMLKYLEMADEAKPHSLRVSLLAATIGKRSGMSNREVENVKSAALLAMAGELRSSLPLFEQAADYMNQDRGRLRSVLDGREQVLLKTTASLLKEIEPLLFSYFKHYVQEANILDKNLGEVSIGASVLALAEILDDLQNQGKARLGGEEITSFKDIERLSDRAFPGRLVEVLRDVILTL